jgi:hypothetical protein
MGGSWLDQGHGDGESLAPVTGVPSLEVVDPSDRGSASWHSRSSKVVVAALAAVAVIGSAGTAYAIRETLFPSLGAPTSSSVWSNPVPPDESVPSTSTVASSTTSTSTLPATSTVPVDTAPVVSDTVTSVEDHPDVVAAQVGSGGSGGRVSHTLVPDESGEHASTTAPVTNTGPSVPESVETTPEPESGSGSGGSGSGGGTDNSGSGKSTDDDAPKPDDTAPKSDDTAPKSDDD